MTGVNAQEFARRFQHFHELLHGAAEGDALLVGEEELGILACCLYSHDLARVQEPLAIAVSYDQTGHDVG